MHLPEVQVVGLQVVESGGQVILGFLPGAAVGLAGEENPVQVMPASRAASIMV
jgi:hypothetical protein